MTPSGPLGRDSMAFREKMVKYHGEIERLVYAAEILCPYNKENLSYKRKCDGCPFKLGWLSIYECQLKAARKYIGDHIEQHDCMVPPCQCAGDCGKGKVRE